MGWKVKELREERKLTQSELAEKTGLSRVTINNIENGNVVNLRIDTMRKLAAALKTTPGRLFFDDDVNQFTEEKQ